MTIKEVVLMKKAEALNKIRKIYHPDFDGYEKLDDFYYDDQGYTRLEQRDIMVKDIIYNLERDLKKLKTSERFERTKNNSNLM